MGACVFLQHLVHWQGSVWQSSACEYPYPLLFPKRHGGRHWVGWKTPVYAHHNQWWGKPPLPCSLAELQLCQAPTALGVSPCTQGSAGPQNGDPGCPPTWGEWRSCSQLRFAHWMSVLQKLIFLTLRKKEPGPLEESPCSSRVITPSWWLLHHNPLPRTHQLFRRNSLRSELFFSPKSYLERHVPQEHVPPPPVPKEEVGDVS